MKKFTSLCIISAVVACALLLARATTSRADALVTQATPPPAAAGGNHGAVTKDKVNVRARASKIAEVVCQLNKGDSVEILERKTSHEGDKEMEWLRIPLPATANCYVASKFIKDGETTADAVNIRCGPGSSYKDVGKLAKGEKVEVVGTHGEWTQIKPTSHCTGWVAAEFVEVAPAPAAPSPSASAAPEIVTPPVALPLEPLPTTPGIRPAEGESDVRVRYVVKDGILRAVEDAANAPGSYELLTEEVGYRQYRIAYLETTEKNLQRYEGKHVRVMGNERWRKGDRYPVIAVERVDMVW